MTRTAQLGQTPFAVVDIEATGIYPGGHDRIIEVAVVRIGPDLELEDEWVTLVNPRRDIGRTDLHGIQAADVAQAPLFEEIFADVGTRVSGAIVVGHHLRFDLGFLAVEFERAGVRMPRLPSLCTLALAHDLLPDSPSRKLVYCCEQVGILFEDEHTALGDARATAQLLAVFIQRARDRGRLTLQDLGCETVDVPGPDWLGGRRPSGRRVGRDAAAVTRSEERSYLARLVERTLGDEARNAREAEYLALVDRALQDRRVSPAEAEELAATAKAWGMTRSDALEAHRAYLASLVSEALVDAHVTPQERRDLAAVCDMLGLHRAALDVLLSEPVPRASRQERPSGSELRGKSVCFTGELLGRLRGGRITREVAEKLAVEAGLDVRASVTKKLDILVVADADTQSIKARKARQYGVQIIAEPAFWKVLQVRAE
ncbi:MAG: exonuclease domain-containing protein [Candidatus Rokuibacteriota bacterium]